MKMVASETHPAPRPSRTNSTGKKGSSAGTFFSDVSKLVFGATLGQVLAVALSPVLTRLYAPEQYGELAIFVSVSSILGIVACLRYEVALLLPRRTSDAAALLVACLGFTVLMTMLTAVIILVAGEAMARRLGSPTLATCLALVPVQVMFMGCFQSLRAWHSRISRFGSLSGAEATKSFTTVLSKLAMGTAGRASGGALIGASLAGQAAAVCVLLARMPRRSWRCLRRSMQVANIFRQLRRYRKFPQTDLWGALLNHASWHLPAVLFAIFFSKHEIGLYAFSFRILHLPMLLLGSSLGQVFFQRISRACAGSEPMDDLTLLVFGRMLTCALFPLFIVFTAGPELFAYVFGPAWREAGTYARVLSPWVLCWLVASPISLLLLAEERHSMILLFHIAVFATRFAAIVIGGMRADILLALQLFAATGIFAYGALASVVLRHAGVSLSRVVRTVRLPLFCAAGPALVLWFVARTCTTAPPVLYSSVAALLAYAVLVLWLDHDLRHLTVEKVRSLFHR